VSTPTLLPAEVVARLASATAHRPARFLRPALVRAALYLVPVPLALAASEPLGRVPWAVPVGALVAGWSALTALAWLGRRHAARAGAAGAAGAARLVLAGFAAVTAAWSAVLALAPSALAGGDRALAFGVSLPALAILAALAAAHATGTEARLLGWSVPALLVAGAVIAGWLPRHGWALPAPSPVRALDLPAEPVLLAAIGVLAVRAFAPALRRAGRRPRWPRWPRLAEVRRGGAYLVLGLAQAAAVAAVWGVTQAATPIDGVPPAMVPPLLAVPLIEVLVGWHLARLGYGLARYDDRDRYLRYLRRLGWTTLVAVLPPLVSGAALAGTAARLPFRLSVHPDAPALVLSLAGGVLLAGVFALGCLLAARHRPGVAALVTGGPVLAAPALAAGVPGLAATSLSGWGQLLPATVLALAVAYAAGLVLAAQVLCGDRDHEDFRRHR
jgi:hypothetical protein